ncbi:MAG: PKD-like domain-containing protein [Deltaproteobacteria bacterium]
MTKRFFFLSLILMGLIINSCTKEELDKPEAKASPAAVTITTGSSFSVSLTSNIAGTTFSWTVNQVGVTGATAGNGSTISQTLTLTGQNQGKATYTVTPVADGVKGDDITVVVTVDPVKKITYNANIKPIFAVQCGVCHLAGGNHPLKLDNYTAAKGSITEILNRVQLAPGNASFMPKGGSKLSDANINIIKQWQADGLLEN